MKGAGYVLESKAIQQLLAGLVGAAMLSILLLLNLLRFQLCE
jgi:hypothetical protein